MLHLVRNECWLQYALNRLNILSQLKYPMQIIPEFVPSPVQKMNNPSKLNAIMENNIANS